MVRKLRHEGSRDEHDHENDIGQENWNSSQVELNELNTSQSMHSVSEVERETMETEHDEEKDSAPKQTNESSENNEQVQEEMKEKDVDLLMKFKKRLEDDDKTVFYDMFELMITKMSCIEANLTDVKVKQEGLSSKVAILENVMGRYEQNVTEMEDDVADVSDMNIKLVQATIKCDENYRIVAKKVKSISRAVNKGMYICYGLANKKGSNAKETVMKFFKEKLGLKETSEVCVTTAYMIGKKDHSPIVFQLQDPNDVGRVFTKMTDIKPKNAKDRKIVIKDYLDEEDREEKKRHQDLVQDNRNLPISHQSTMKHQKLNLMINSEKYEKEVEPPLMKEVLMQNRNVEEAFAKLKIHSGSMRQVSGSTFYAYAIQSDNFEKSAKCEQSHHFRNYINSIKFIVYHINNILIILNINTSNDFVQLCLLSIFSFFIVSKVTVV